MDHVCAEYVEGEGEEAFKDKIEKAIASVEIQKCTQCGQIWGKPVMSYHVECPNCKYEFCFNCGGPYPGNMKQCPVPCGWMH